MIKIVTDSTCDLSAELHEQHDITVVPINIQFGTDSYLDDVTIDKATFYRKIDELGILPKTSQPSAGQFEEYYTRLAKAGATDIVSIHVTAKLSGTYQSAQLAKEMVADRVRIHPFDSACGSGGLGFMSLEAARLAEGGKNVAEILARMKTIRSRMNILLTVKDLRFSQMSGRVGKLQGSLASLLNVKPIVLLEDGLLDVAEKVRTRRKAIDRMIEIMATVHALAPDMGHALLERTKTVFNCKETFVSDLALSLAVQFGPGTLGLIAYSP
jgi:DegV family protein with EDD domain